jgi:hypothetical protein
MVLPGELEHLVVENRETLAEHGCAEICERLDLSGQGDCVEPRRPFDPSGAFVELPVAEFEALGEADFAAHDLAGDLEPHRRRLVAGLCGGVIGRRKQPECAQRDER